MMYADNNKLNWRFFLLVSIACISWLISGLVSAIPGVRGIAMLAFEICAVFGYLAMPRYKDGCFQKVLILYVLAMSSMLVFEKLTGYTSDTVNWFSFVYPFCLLLIGKIIIDNSIGRGLLMSFLIIDILVKILVTFSLYGSNNAIMKEATIGYADATGITHMVIQYGFMYLVPVIALLVMMVSFKKGRSLESSKWILLFVVLCLLLVLSQISLLIFLTPLYLLLYFLYLKNGKISRAVIISMILMAVLLINFSSIINLMNTWGIFGDAVKLRLLGISNVLEGGSAYINSTFTGNMAEGDTVVNRIGSYQMSVNAFLNNFWFGYATSNYIPAGGHSTWVDFVAHYGIGVSFLIFSVFLKSYTWLKKIYAEFRIELNLVFAYVCVVGILNNISITNCCIILYILFPLFTNYLRDLK